MAAIEIGRQCGVCTRQHTFCEPSSDSLTLGKVYEYVCPFFGIMGRFTAAEAWKIVAESCPPDAVIVWPAGPSPVP